MKSFKLEDVWYPITRNMKHCNLDQLIELNLYLKGCNLFSKDEQMLDVKELSVDHGLLAGNLDGENIQIYVNYFISMLLEH
jgi:hypothetical protein